MKTKQMIKGVVLAIVAALALLSSTTIWANSLALEECVLREGRCLSTGCETRGGVCGMPEEQLPQVKKAGKAVDKCWCLF